MVANEIDDRELDVFQYSPVCSKCKHEGLELRRCKAFGDNDIPLSIWEGKNKHTNPVDGNHGIQFEKWEE